MNIRAASINGYLLVVHYPLKFTNSTTFICLCAWLVVLASKPNINKSIPIEKCILFAFARVQIVSVCAANLFEYEYEYECDCEYT